MIQIVFEPTKHLTVMNIEAISDEKAIYSAIVILRDSEKKNKNASTGSFKIRAFDKINVVFHDITTSPFSQ